MQQQAVLMTCQRMKDCTQRYVFVMHMQHVHVQQPGGALSGLCLLSTVCHKKHRMFSHLPSEAKAQLASSSFTEASQRLASDVSAYILRMQTADAVGQPAPMPTASWGLLQATHNMTSLTYFISEAFNKACFSRYE